MRTASTKDMPVVITKPQKHDNPNHAVRNDFEREDIQYLYTRQRRQLGLGHAVLCAREVVREPFVVALGDSIIGLHAESKVVGAMIEQFEGMGHEDTHGNTRLRPQWQHDARRGNRKKPRLHARRDV